MVCMLRLVRSLCLLAFPAFSQNPYTTSPRNYQLVFENDSVRVSKAMFAPGDRLPVHEHPAGPTVFVYLTDGGPIKFTHVEPKFTVERKSVKAGAVRFHTGSKETHIVEYMGDAPSEYFRIELKTDRPEKKTGTLRVAAGETKPFEDSQLRISRSECAPNESCAPLEHPSVVVTLKDRSVSWHLAGSRYRNESAEPLHQIRLELKTKPLPQ